MRFPALAICLAALAAAWRFTPLAELITTERVMALARDFAGQPRAPFVVLVGPKPGAVGPATNLTTGGPTMRVS